MIRTKSNILQLLISLIIAVTAWGCTRNNGNIGPIFGTWRLEELKIDGEDASDYDKNCFWSFQNDIIAFTTIVDDKAHSAIRRWGTYEKQDGYFVLNLSHHGDGDNDYLYGPQAVLRLPRQEAVPLKIISESSKKMILSYTTDAGEIVTYVLIKQ